MLYSPAFRRLAGVTQVVHAGEGHIFHNRMTHTLKVAQIARRLAEHLGAVHECQEILDPDVVEAAGLIHDLGHPPFGHIAEEELDGALIRAGYSDGFEGNAQSFRIVTKVSTRQLEHPGLNLTRATLNATLKYPWARAHGGKESHKWGYYFSELEDFQFARALQKESGNTSQSIEAALMDWADDVTYSVHDVEDFYRAGLVPLHALLTRGREWERFLNENLTAWRRGKTGRTIRSGDRFFRCLSTYAYDELHLPFSGRRSQIAGLNDLTSFLIRRYVLGPPDVVAVTVRADGGGIEINEDLRAEVDLLKQVTDFYVFRNPALVTQQHGQRKVVRTLFEILADAALSASHSIIPQPFKDLLAQCKSELERVRLVVDLIASMTEKQAHELHQRLTGLHSGSVSDLMTR